MNLKLDRAHHWYSATCFTAAFAMFCVGNTYLENPVTHGNTIVSVLYWGTCAAFAVASAAFTCMGMIQARHELDLIESRVRSKRISNSCVRVNIVPNGKTSGHNA